MIWWNALRVSVASLLLASLPVSDVRAQPTRALGELRREVKPGDTLRVHHRDGSRTTGDFISVDADRLTLAVDGRLVTIADADIREVAITSDGLKNGALIGLVAGAGFGFMASNAMAGSSGDSLADAATAGDVALIGAAIFAAAGTGIGIGIDALVRRYRVLYAAPVQVTPVVVPGVGYGVVFHVAW